MCVFLIILLLHGIDIYVSNRYLSIAFTMGSILSNVGVFIAGLSTSARGIAYMANADVKMLPRFLSLSSSSFFSSAKEDDNDENATNPWVSLHGFKTSAYDS